MKLRRWILGLFLLAGVFTLATELQPRALGWIGEKDTDQLVQVMLGDSRQILADHLFVEADIYFHSGYYPSVFDRSYAPTNSQHLIRDDHRSPAPDRDPIAESADNHDEAEHEKAMSFLAPPLDWIERFGRRFAITSHTHLAHGHEREILPWLRLSADLDPQRVETYTTAAYWLRRDLGKAKEAEQFLREGLAANPSSYEILLELGRLYDENYHDSLRARNNWRAALKRWMETEPAKPKPDVLPLGQIAVRLARIEEREGRCDQAIALLNLVISHQATPNPEALREQIRVLQKRLPEGSQGK